jgi:hypothetical protein
MLRRDIYGHKKQNTIIPRMILKLCKESRLRQVHFGVFFGGFRSK